MKTKEEKKAFKIEKNTDFTLLQICEQLKEAGVKSELVGEEIVLPYSYVLEDEGSKFEGENLHITKILDFGIVLRCNSLNILLTNLPVDLLGYYIVRNVTFKVRIQEKQFQHQFLELKINYK